MTKYSEFTGDTSLFIGRWQCPLHAGHTGIIRKVLEEGGKVCIGIRDSKIDEKNPYNVQQRIVFICKEFEKEIMEGTVTWAILPDIKDVCHGRKVGWGVREIRLDEKKESISGTKTREKLRNEGKL